MENKDFERTTEVKMKKMYHTAKLEKIGYVRDTTKGAGGTYNDGSMNQFTMPPSQPTGN